MRYIDHILQPGETVLRTSTVHWIVYLPGVALEVLALAALIAGSALPRGLRGGGIGVAVSRLVSAVDHRNRRHRSPDRL